MYKKARVISRTGCMVRAYMSMKAPYMSNALVIGDAAAYVEVEVQGALMCGYHAGNAVYKELNGEDGFKQYTAWWQNSFEFNSDEYLLVAQGYALVPTYTDDELDYLFSLIEQETLDGAYGQYRAPRLMWDAILRHKERIAKEKPQLYEKIKKNREMTLQGTFD
jgi:flavin-dependent dehydrogenase